MKLVIKRSEWLRGKGARNSYLLRPEDGKKCCLGFFALALGMEERTISGVGAPSSLPFSPWPAWMLMGKMQQHTPACSSLVLHNDSPTLSDPEREKKIKSIFAEHGVEVEFTDE